MANLRRWWGTMGAALALAVLAGGCFAGPGIGTTSCGMDAISQQVLTDLNASRTSNRLPPLAANGQLTCLAQGWSSYMASTGTFAHRNLSAVLSSPGYAGHYSTLGENILMAPASYTAADMNTAWWNSPDHRANMLSPSYSSVGIGVAYANGEVWATEDFGG